MITFIKGNLFDSDCEAWVNTTNTVGVMGKGIALEFKKRFPQLFEDYKKLCKTGEYKAGNVWLWRNPAVLPGTEGRPKYIFNFATKGHWRNPSQYYYIADGLSSLVLQMRDFDIKSIAIPPLGCGNGGLSWDKVKPMIQTIHNQYWQATQVVVYEP